MVEEVFVHLIELKQKGKEELQVKGWDEAWSVLETFWGITIIALIEKAIEKQKKGNKKTERGGFEPPKAHHLTRLPIVHLRPLGHLSLLNLKIV